MTKDEEALCATLAAVCELRTPQDIDSYVATLDALKASESEDVLRAMLKCLRDTEAGEVQYELVEACESFEPAMYIKALVQEGLEMEKKSPWWFGLMLQSILNSPADAEMAIREVNALPDSDRDAYRTILGRIAEHTPKYREHLRRIR
jgi:hypothetical protein